MPFPLRITPRRTRFDERSQRPSDRRTDEHPDKKSLGLHFPSLNAVGRLVNPSSAFQIGVRVRSLVRKRRKRGGRGFPRASKNQVVEKSERAALFGLVPTSRRVQSMWITGGEKFWRANWPAPCACSFCTQVHAADSAALSLKMYRCRVLRPAQNRSSRRTPVGCVVSLKRLRKSLQPRRIHKPRERTS